MHYDDQGTNASALDKEPHISHEVILELLHCQIRNSIAPLGLEIDCAHLRLWGEQQGWPRFRHQLLIRELKNWNQYLCRRPVNRFYLHQPFAILDAPNLTELVYSASQNLKLNQGKHTEYLATLNESDVTSENIALLKGLQFNHIRLLVPLDYDIEQLSLLQQQIRDYKISHISFALTFSLQERDCNLHLLQLLSFLEPETLQLQPGSSEAIPGLPALLMQFGYYLRDATTIIRTKSPLHTSPIDCLRLGPGSCSRFGALRTTNFHHPDAYQERLSKCGLPIATCR